MPDDPLFQQRFKEIRDLLMKTAAENVSAMHYYQRRWDEDRGDEYAAWGCSDWYFEAAPDGTVVRQMEVYDNGAALQYHANHIEDTYGGLSEAALDHVEFSAFAIAREDFEAAWLAHPPSHPL
jgi:hypothetical protein